MAGNKSKEAMAPRYIEWNLRAILSDYEYISENLAPRLLVPSNLVS